MKLHLQSFLSKPEAEFKEFKPRLKYGGFHLKLYSIFQDLSRRPIETGFCGIWGRGLNSLNSDTDHMNGLK